MREFAKAYPDFPILQPVAAKLEKSKQIKPKKQDLQPPAAKLNGNIDDQFALFELAQIPWTHHTIILDKCKAIKERLFYIQKTIKNGWSKSVLSLQIQSELYKRQGNAITNFEQTLPTLQSDLANETLKSPYLLEFLELDEEIKERELETALIHHLKEFMLELGRGFSFVGRQKNIVVGGDDFFLDLLFFNYILNCFVVFELKVGDFKPEFAGKLNFYVNTINEQLKEEFHNPTIGVLLCKTPNETVVKYSLKGINSPIGVADYELAKALPKKLKGAIPSVEELEQEIEKEYQELKSPSQKRFEALKEKIANLNREGIQQLATTPILYEIIDNSLIPLYKALLKKMEDFKDLFISCKYNWQSNKELDNISHLAESWKNENFLKTYTIFYFSYRLHGFKEAGLDAFDSGFQLNFKVDRYWYGLILLNHQEPVIKKAYGKQFTNEDIEKVVEEVYNIVLEDIEKNIERLNENK
jgi:predicted nuclease of restriction endonuclease-like (RecB) superfamily